jgi:glycosyltransferase involved in cell wall biosynthesis
VPPETVLPLRLAVYTDYPYTSDGESVFAERAFALFLARLQGRLERMTIVGRLQPSETLGRYRLPPGTGFAPLPYYESLAKPVGASHAMVRSLVVFWRTLDEVDACWLLGPHPLAIAFAAMALARRRKVFLGVRQDWPEYVRNRHPGRRSFALAAWVLEFAYRGLARRCGTVVVGPALAQRYRSGRVLEIAVSLVETRDIVKPDEARSRSYEGELTILSVGRMDEEKNPLMLADVLARLVTEEPSWRLVVCGEGPLEAALRERLDALGVADRSELAGYVEQGPAMLRRYRSAHFLLHPSWTEGLPQVMVEALAAGLPVVATDVGGIGAALGDAVSLIAPGDVEGAAGALRALADDPDSRDRMVSRGLEYARNHTLDTEVDRVVSFFTASAGGA